MFNSNSPGIIQVIPTQPITKPIFTIAESAHTKLEYHNSQGADSTSANIQEHYKLNTNSSQSTRVIKLVNNNPKLINEYNHKKNKDVATPKVINHIEDLNNLMIKIDRSDESSIVAGSYSMTFVYKNNFPEFKHNDTSNKSTALNVLVDQTDNALVDVGSEIIHVVYGKYYDSIYQFNKDFINRVGNNFEITNLSSSLKFNMDEYKLSGNIPFTESKNISITINGTYKFKLTLVVDVREDY